MVLKVINPLETTIKRATQVVPKLKNATVPICRDTEIIASDVFSTNALSKLDFNTFIHKHLTPKDIKKVQTYMSEGMEFNFSELCQCQFSPFTGEVMSEKVLLKSLNTHLEKWQRYAHKVPSKYSIAKDMEPRVRYELFQNEAARIFASGNKPAAYVEEARIDIVPLIQRKNIPGLDCIVYKGKCPEYGVILLNQKQVKGIIAKDLNFFRQRLNLDEKSGVDDIYKLIAAQENSPLTTGYQDIMGQVLGYPQKNSYIFQLYSDVANKTEIAEYRSWYSLRGSHSERLCEYKKVLKDELYSPQSTYCNMSDSFKEKVSDAIEKIEEVKHSNEVLFGSLSSNRSGYHFIYFTPEPNELDRIRRSILDFEKQTAYIFK